MSYVIKEEKKFGCFDILDTTNDDFQITVWHGRELAERIVKYLEQEEDEPRSGAV